MKIVIQTQIIYCIINNNQFTQSLLCRVERENTENIFYIIFIHKNPELLIKYVFFFFLHTIVLIITLHSAVSNGGQNDIWVLHWWTLLTFFLPGDNLLFLWLFLPYGHLWVKVTWFTTMLCTSNPWITLPPPNKFHISTLFAA